MERPRLESLTRLGAEVRAAGVLHDPGLGALYALPSGTVLARADVDPLRTQLVDRLAAVVGGREVEGPFLRSGDREARIFWRDPAGREYGLTVPFLERLLRDPGRLVVLPEARTRRALPRRRDLPLE